MKLTRFFLSGLLALFSLLAAAKSTADTTKPFITTWQVLVEDTIDISLTGTGYAFDYEWVLQSDTTVKISGFHADSLGTFRTMFADSGSYDLSIYGNFPRLLNYPKSQLIDVKQWGDIAWNSMAGMFKNWPGEGFTASDAPDLSKVSSMKETFQDASDFNADLSNWDVSNVTDLSFTFRSARSFNGDITTWNTANVTRLDGTFLFAGNFNKDIGGWNVEKVTTMENCFRGTPFNQDIGGWVTTSLTNLKNTFQNASSFNQNLGSWNTSNVTDMSNCFNNAKEFNQDISGWNTTKVKNMGALFKGALVFNQPIQSWDVSNVTAMNQMFESAKAFNQPIGAWIVSKVTTMANTFRGASSFNQDISDWDVSNVTNMKDMFRSAGVFNQPIHKWNVSKVTSMRQMFDNADAFNQPIGEWDVSSVSTFREMFRQNDAFNQSLGAWKFKPGAEFLATFNNMASLDCESWSSTVLGWNFSNPTLEDLNVGGPNLGLDSAAFQAKEELIARGWNLNGSLTDTLCTSSFEFPCADITTVSNDILFGDLTIRANQGINLDSVMVEPKAKLTLSSPAFNLSPTSVFSESAVVLVNTEGCPE